MPCTVAWHPSDDDRSKVTRCREEAEFLCTVIRELEKFTGEKSRITPEQRVKIVSLMGKNIPLPVVQIRGLENYEVPGQEGTIAYLKKVGNDYGDLYTALTVEACRMCKLMFAVQGKNPRVAQKFWNQHRCTRGHDED